MPDLQPAAHSFHMGKPLVSNREFPVWRRPYTGQGHYRALGSAKLQS